MGIHVTPLSPTCSVVGHGGRLSTNADGVGGAVQRRSGLPRVSGGAAVAGRVCLSGMWRRSGPDQPPARSAGPAEAAAGRAPVAAGSSRGLAAQALAAGHASRSRRSGSPGRLSGRVHVPLQPPHVGVAGQSILSPGPTGRAGRTRSGRFAGPPQPIAGCGVMWIPLNGNGLVRF